MRVEAESEFVLVTLENVTDGETKVTIYPRGDCGSEVGGRLQQQVDAESRAQSR